jgi:thiol-disulfide isomerase/thioredoxin
MVVSHWNFFITFASQHHSIYKKPNLMKFTKLFLLSLCLICGINVSAREKRINTPYWVYSPARDFVIKGVTLSETASSLDVYIREGEGGSWCLDSAAHIVAEGKNYKIISIKRYMIKDGKAESAEFNLKNWYKVGKGQTDSLIINFEPMPNKVKFFDFIENDESDWIALGISTTGEPYPSQLKLQKKISSGQTWQPFVPKYDKATLKGHIYGYSPKMRISASHRNAFTNKNDISFHIDSLGNFRAETQCATPINMYLEFGRSYLTCQLVPGEEQTLDVDLAILSAKDLEEQNKQYKKHGTDPYYVFSGTTATNSNILNKNLDYQPEKFDTTTTFNEFISDIWNVYQKKLKEIDTDKSYNKQERAFAKLYLQKYYIDLRSEYASNIFYKYRVINDSIANIKAMAANKQFTNVDDHAKDLNIFNDMCSPYVITSNYNFYLSYMKANGLKQGSVYEWLNSLEQACQTASDINSLKIVTSQITWDSISPVYLPILKMMNDTAIVLKAKLDKMTEGTDCKIKICKAPDCTDNMFTAIAAQYKGKVLMIDCWATWCGPCCRGISAMTPIEEELAKQGAVFAFVTNTTSPVADWMEMIQKMPGDHYRFNYEQWEKLKGLNGIPRYKIFDRSGKEILDQTGWSNDLKDTFVKTITEALQSK